MFPEKEDPINKKHLIGFLVYRLTLLLLREDLFDRFVCTVNHAGNILHIKSILFCRVSLPILFTKMTNLPVFLTKSFPIELNSKDLLGLWAKNSNLNNFCVIVISL